MAVKLKFHDHICFVELGKWSCETEPELAADIQQICDDHFAKPDEYVVDIDEQSAKYIAQLIAAEIIEITYQPFDPNEPLRVY